MAILTVAVSAVLFVKIIFFAKYLAVAQCYDFSFQNLCVEPSIKHASDHAYGMRITVVPIMAC